MAARRGWVRGTTAFAALALAVAAGRVGRGGGGGGGGGIPASAGHAGAYVAAHALTLALCPPYAIFFEGGAALVFSAKVLGAVLLDRQELLRSERLLDNHRRNGVLFYTGDHNGVGVRNGMLRLSDGW